MGKSHACVRKCTAFWCLTVTRNPSPVPKSCIRPCWILNRMSILTIQFVEGQNIPSRKIAVIGAPQAADMVMFIWVRVPPTIVIRYAVIVESTPTTTTTKNRGSDTLRDKPVEYGSRWVCKSWVCVGHVHFIRRGYSISERGGRGGGGGPGNC